MKGKGKEATEPGLEKDLRVICVHMKNQGVKASWRIQEWSGKL